MKKIILSLLMAIVAISSFSQIKISQMPEHMAKPVGADVPIVIGGVNKKVKADSIAAILNIAGKQNNNDTTSWDATKTDVNDNKNRYRYYSTISLDSIEKSFSIPELIGMEITLIAYKGKTHKIYTGDSILKYRAEDAFWFNKANGRFTYLGDTLNESNDIVINYNGSTDGKRIVNMKNFLGKNTPGYPVGVFDVAGNYLGTAANQSEYITLWNADPDNATEGLLQAGANSLEFKIGDTATITEVRGLRYYQYTAYTGAEIFVGGNDIVVYGSTIKKGSVDGVYNSTEVFREWNMNLFGAIYKIKVTADSVFSLLCTGYVNNTPLYVFHNEDSHYAGVRHSYGLYTIQGSLPRSLLAFYGIGQQTTNYNLVTNWSQLKNLYAIFVNHSGGNPWQFTTPSLYPSVNKLQITKLMMGQIVSELSGVAVDITNTNYPNVKEVVITSNAGSDILSASAGWFLTMPKVNQYLRIDMPATTATNSDNIWNNIATALSGITPIGSVKELRVIGTNAVTAASLTARNNLTSAGWTVLTN